MTLRVGSSSSRHQVTSVVSPNVHTMAMPVPLSGWASGWATTGTSTPNRGVRTVEPINDRKRSSSGWATIATQLTISSGRVVSMRTSPSAPWKAIRW